MVATTTARNQNINNLLICKYRMIMPKQTRGNFKLFIVFLLTKFGFIGSWFFLSHSARATTGIYILCSFARALLCLLYFRLLEKINIYLTCFRTEETTKNRSDKWTRGCVCVRAYVCVWTHCVFNQTAFDDIHLDA